MQIQDISYMLASSILVQIDIVERDTYCGTDVSCSRIEKLTDDAQHTVGLFPPKTGPIVAKSDRKRLHELGIGARTYL
jgi:hypothetical protein